MGPTDGREVAVAREARLELTVRDGQMPEGVPVHVKLDTGMGRWGLAELPELSGEVVGLVTHLATADTDLEFARAQVAALRGGDEAVRAPDPARREQRRGAAAARSSLRRRPLRDRALRALAVRHRSGRGRSGACARLAIAAGAGRSDSTGREHGLRPSLRRRARDVDRHRPVGYADGFRRDMTGTEVLVEGERRPVVGTISMDALAVELPSACRGDARDADRRRGARRGARCRRGDNQLRDRLGIDSGPSRAKRTVVDA